MNELQIFLLIFLILGLIFLFTRFAETKQVKAHANSLNTYINNLGFTPNRIGATLIYINKRYKNLYSQTTIDALSFDRSKYLDKGLWLPLLGVFMDTKKKVFAVRSNKNETNPKVYSFSQLKCFEPSEDVSKSMEWALIVPSYLPVIVPMGGKSLGKLSMRIVLSGINGTEYVTLEPALLNTIPVERINVNNTFYKQKFDQLMDIADCLQQIKNNA